MNTTTRRRFLTTSTAAFAAPFILTSRRAAAADAVGKTVRLGHIGIGGQGTGLLQNFLGDAGRGQRRHCRSLPASGAKRPGRARQGIPRPRAETLQ